MVFVAAVKKVVIYMRTAPHPAAGVLTVDAAALVFPGVASDAALSGLQSVCDADSVSTL